MMRSTYKILAALVWLAPAAIGVRYWQVWELLPLRLATHFNAQGRANGWMNRETSLYYGVGFVALTAAILFVVLMLVEKKYSLSRLSWTLLVFFHSEIWTIVYLQFGLLEYNLTGSKLKLGPLPIVTAIGVVIVIAVAMTEQRGAALSRTDVLAEEVHAGKAWGAAFLVALIPSVLLAVTIPNPVTRAVSACLGVMLLLAFALSWDGFRYYFTRHGIEIRALGFRLKSIPLIQIRDYEIQSWNPLRGFGIRGMGNCKAYVWGKTGVRVDLYDGQVFLGHSDPQRIVHDLNAMKQDRN